ncbi:MAG TPA: sensor domain-containing diguanylate cyclase, partial [Steroidobacteraceae bacterium]|nr:sensor domain-containing diguanylate cyclase [Steroidobacteraceae bacterium]
MWLMGVLLGLLLAASAGGVAAWYLLRRQSSSMRAARYAARIEQSPNGLLIVEAETLRLVDANPAAQHGLGYAMPELRAKTLLQLFDSEGLDAEAIARLRDPDPSAPLRLRQLCRDGRAMEVEVTGHRLQVQEQTLLAFTIYDVSLRRRVEAQLLEKQQHLDHLAHHDLLTGLPNRLYLAHHLPGAIEEAKRNNTMLAVLFLDLDRFKHINDSRGHETGDKLLKQVAERVRATVRAEDMVVRMGGDEFIVVLQSIRRTEVISEMAERINRALSTPIVVDGRPLVATASIGIGLYPRDGTDMGELLRHSDTAMYQAKDRGRNNFQLFSLSMDQRLKERIAIESSLRTALQSRQLDVH